MSAPAKKKTDTTPEVPVEQRTHLKPGEELVKSGGRLSHLWLVQKGSFFVNQARSGEFLEWHYAAPGEVIGEEGFFGTILSQSSASALSQTLVRPLSLHDLNSDFKNSPPKLKAFLKGVYERLKVELQDIKSAKGQQVLLPCPPEWTARLFGTIFHGARLTGTLKDGVLVCQWNEFDVMTREVLQGDSERIKQCLLILVKLGYVEVDRAPSQSEESKTSPDANIPTADWFASGAVLRFQDMSQIETFFDFYQNYFFKPGYSQFLKTNDKIIQTTVALLKVSKDAKADRMGVVRVPFKSTVDTLKQELGKTFEADHLFRLEQKGLMVKRIASNDGGILSFWRAEFEQMLLNWKVLKEVEQWNARGFVSMEGFQPSQREALQQAQREALLAEHKRVAEKLLSWQPPLAAGKVPTLRTEAPKQGELLCSVCMTPYKKGQATCSTCDEDLK